MSVEPDPSPSTPYFPPPGRTPVPVQVLQYATPVSKRRFRKPLKTQLLLSHHTPPTVTECSAEKSQAVGAIIFSIFPLLIMGWMAFDGWQRSLKGFRSRIGEAAFLSSMCVVLIACVLAVIWQVWRKTVLVAEDGGLSVIFSSVFGSRQRQFPPGAVAEVTVWTTDEGDKGTLEPLGELHLRPVTGETLKLFRDYPRRQLDLIARSLSAALGIT
jgi:hypothetical protein